MIPRTSHWFLKSCPRCRGDMYRDEDGYQCLQCGHIKYFEKPLIKDNKVEKGEERCLVKVG